MWLLANWFWDTDSKYVVAIIRAVNTKHMGLDKHSWVF